MYDSLESLEYAVPLEDGIKTEGKPQDVLA